jgi:hypothetical protein
MLTNLIENARLLFEKYKDQPYMLQKLETYLTNLPNFLENEQKKYNERIARMQELTMEQDNFYKVFLSKNQYYYMPHNNLYYEYDGKTYKIVREDDIHHNLLSSITDDKKLIAWKYKTKQIIIRKIKERNLLKSTPETFTIQTVLSFLNTIFGSKSEAKYFLAVLGDCILRKITNDNPLLFFVSSNLKKMIQIIDNISYVTTGNTIINYFITKYHDSHNVKTYRLIKTNSNEISYDFIKDMMNNIGLDLLCVASHYSCRNDKSDKFLVENADDSVKNHVLFFVNNSIENIIEDFKTQCIEIVNSNNDMHFISWKNMHYIWKQFLSSCNIPNILYSNSLKEFLKLSLSYKDKDVNNPNNDIIFTGITSKFLPKVSSFLHFWENHIIIMQNKEFSSENGHYDGDGDCDRDEYELDELVSLHKLENNNMSNYVSLNENDIIKMINHYYPQLDIIDNKYVCNIKCKLWNKEDEINDMFDIYKSNKNICDNAIIVETDDTEQEILLSLDELYENYQSYCHAKHAMHEKFTPIISKQYFEKYAKRSLQDYIKFDTFIDCKLWFTNK